MKAALGQELFRATYVLTVVATLERERERVWIANSSGDLGWKDGELVYTDQLGSRIV